jgi:hypothetical protein
MAHIILLWLVFPLFVSQPVFFCSNFACPFETAITKSYFCSWEALISNPACKRINLATTYPVLLLPSINGWFVTILSRIAAAYSTGEGYNSLLSKVANGPATAASSAPLSLTPLLPPNLSINKLWIFRRLKYQSFC